MNDGLHLSEEGAKLVQAFEGCLKPVGRGRFKPYVCPAGVLTIGWGHTNHHGRKFKAGDVWTQAQCDAEFLSDMKGFEAAVKRLVRVELNQQQFDALTSFAYNCGEGNLGKSTLLRKVNRGDFPGAAREFAKWNRGGGRVLAGLTRRRACEALVFQGFYDANHDGKADGPRRSTKQPIYGLMAQSVDMPDDQPGEEAPSGISEGAKVAGGLTLTGAAYSVWEALAQAPDTILHALIAAAQKPSFWLFLGIGGTAFYIYWRRREMKKAAQ